MSSPPGWSRSESPFHAGERAIQTRLGVREKLEAMARRVSIRDVMPDQHRDFFAELPFILVGTVDGAGQPWASILVGRPGFIQSPDPRHLVIEARPIPGDPLADNLRDGVDIGLLGIELPTRRRNRMNGVVRDAGPRGFSVAVSQSFGNCAKYIQMRNIAVVDPPSAPPPAHRSATLGPADRALIAKADTFFIATANESPDAGAARGADVSHRGGRSGFVRIDDDSLLVPDFAGNLFFNTFGNLEGEPRAGLLFIDFENGDLLYLAGEGSVIWKGPDLEGFKGAERLLRFDTRAVIRLDGALPLRGSAPAFSPALDRTGAWAL